MSEVKNIPDGWEETTLKEYLDLLNGYAFKSDDFENEKINDSYLPILKIKNIANGNANHNDVVFHKVNDNLEKYIIKEGDILIALTGNHPSAITQVVGGISRYYLKDKALLNQRVGKIYSKNENILNNDFIYYFFKWNNTQFHIANQSSGSASQANISKNDVISTPINLPPKPEQKSIASILTAFDDKIELLQAQNKTLEATAQTIFAEWFGKYKIEDKLPIGWSIKELDDLLELIIDYRGKTPLKLGLNWSENGIPAISAKSIKNGKIVRRDAMNFGSEELYSIWMKDELKKGDILLTSEAPLGEMYYINDDTKYILSQRVFALRVNKKITAEYLFHYLFSTNGQTLLQARASGSTVSGIRQSELRKIEIIVPEKNVLDNVSKIFKTAFDKIFTNEEQIQTLTKTRDELLPKLMSGEVRVKM